MSHEPTTFDAQLEDAKRSYQRLGPSEAQRARMLHAIESPPASSAGGTRVGTKLAKLALVTLGLVAAGIAASWRQPPPPPARPAAPPLDAPSAPPEPVLGDLTPSRQVDEHAAATAQPAKPRDRLRKPGERRGRPAAPNLTSELALLQRARRILPRDPTRALDIAEEHARAYPRGMLVQERELLAVQALLAAHRRAEAERRARRFEQSHPSSVHAHRVRVLLQSDED